MDVWAVYEYDGGGWYISQLFATKELAEGYAAERNAAQPTLDAGVEKVPVIGSPG